MDTDVIIAGAGPAGLTLANELRLKGIRVIVIEKVAQSSRQSKAMNLQPRTAEMLELRGLLSRAEKWSIGHIPNCHFAQIPLNYEGLGTRYPYQVGILQGHVEGVLEERLAELGGELRRDWELRGFEQDDEGVTVQGTETLRAQYLIGCDGGRSAVRKLLGVAFPGTEAKHYSTIADVVLASGTQALTTDLKAMFGNRRHGVNGTFGNILPLGQTGLYRFAYTDGRTDRAEVTDKEVAASLRTFYGDEYKLLEVRYASRFGDASRQAEKYRVGRVFLAGDAAHIHLPAGGQGLNLSVQDAFNLGWKLAAVLSGQMPETFLDTYHEERHPVGSRTLDNTRAQNVARSNDLESQAVRRIFTELLDIPEGNHAIAAMISGLDIDYGGLGPIGTRLPDFPIGAGWASERFHFGQGVLFATDDKYLESVSPWSDRVVAERVEGLPWPGMEAVLVRPDGYVCWTAPGEPVTDALRAWFGVTAEAALT